MSYEELLQTMVGKTIKSVKVDKNSDNDPNICEITFTNGDQIEIRSRSPNGLSDEFSYMTVS